MASHIAGEGCGVLQVLEQGSTCSVLQIVADLVLCTWLLLATPKLCSLPLVSMNNSVEYLLRSIPLTALSV